MTIIAEKNTSQGYANPKERNTSLTVLTKSGQSFIIQSHLLIWQMIFNSFQFLIGSYLLYNSVMVSSIHQCEFAIGTHGSPPS